MAGLKAFLAIHMYMGMKHQPNYKSYWEKEGSLFHCPIISTIMSRAQFAQLRRCLHITNPTSYEYIQKGEIGYDKLRQVRWLVDAIQNACRCPLQRLILSYSTIYAKEAREVGNQVLGPC
jgi:hypothetical protein